MKYLQNSIVSYDLQNDYDENYKISSSLMTVELIYTEDINQISLETFSKQMPIIILIQIIYEEGDTYALYCSNLDYIELLRNENYHPIRQSETEFKWVQYLRKFSFKIFMNQ